MLKTLEDLKPNRPKIQNLPSKKILCILEGEFELSYIAKIFKLYNYPKDCLNLTEELIKVAWCDKLPKHINIVSKKNGKCRFNGGGTCKGSPVPTPAIKAFEMFSKDLSIFDSVIVFFDADKDKNKLVENYFLEKFKTLNITNVLLVSIPCFESTLIDFCQCGKCRLEIKYIPHISRKPCDKYKKFFSSLKCFEGSKHLVSNLSINHIKDLKRKTSNLNLVNSTIENFMK